MSLCGEQGFHGRIPIRYLPSPQLHDEGIRHSGIRKILLSAWSYSVQISRTFNACSPLVPPPTFCTAIRLTSIRTLLPPTDALRREKSFYGFACASRLTGDIRGLRVQLLHQCPIDTLQQLEDLLPESRVVPAPFCGWPSPRVR